MKILVTGADGLLGSNLVRELVNRGYRVRAFVQPGRQLKTLECLSIEKYFGCLINYHDIEKASEDCQAIIHCAANTSVWPARSQPTRLILRALKTLSNQ